MAPDGAIGFGGADVVEFLVAVAAHQQLCAGLGAGSGAVLLRMHRLEQTQVGGHAVGDDATRTADQDQGAPLRALRCQEGQQLLVVGQGGGRRHGAVQQLAPERRFAGQQPEWAGAITAVSTTSGFTSKAACFNCDPAGSVRTGSIRFNPACRGRVARAGKAV